MIECKRLKYLDKSCRGFLEITMEGITKLWLGYVGHRWPAGQQVVIGPIPCDLSKWQVQQVLEREMGPLQERARLIHLHVV